MRSTTRRAAASAALVLSGALALSACGSSGGGSATGSAPTPGPVTASSTITASVTASPTATAPGGSTASPTAVATGVGASPSGTTAAVDAACRNLVASDAVKAAVTRDYGTEAHRGHITPRAHQFLYGQCGGAAYAATAFDLTPGATFSDQVAGQDDGSTRKYFSLGANGTWTLIGSAVFPDNGGCLAQIPQALAELWGGCQPGRQG
ncbi:hypothetical protein [Streptacidiphilus neutrinimicus]|uniref:hypothetical protein n=1 Tax=Streptacidiphilus neutrinimicus TaxID=105420 RepID=UPI0005AB8A3D|nr:hypothetical protein [Streptacidiphilus neutrinimicus]